MSENYVKYLEFITKKIDSFYEKQKPFIFCKKGCAECCKHTQFPYSLVEVDYLIQGFNKLPKETQMIIEQNMQKVVEQKKKFTGDKFAYDCPFLIDDVCSVYEHRGVICRCFGLMAQLENGGMSVPYCCDLNLNYSNVLDLETHMISKEKYEKLGCKEEPIAFRVGHMFLTSELFEKKFDFTFGETKSLIEWFVDEE